MERRTPHSSLYSRVGWEPATKQPSETETWPELWVLYLPLFKSALSNNAHKVDKVHHFFVQYCYKKNKQTLTYSIASNTNYSIQVHIFFFFIWEFKCQFPCLVSERKSINISPHILQMPPHGIPMFSFFWNSVRVQLVLWYMHGGKKKCLNSSKWFQCGQKHSLSIVQFVA